MLAATKSTRLRPSSIPALVNFRPGHLKSQRLLHSLVQSCSLRYFTLSEEKANTCRRGQKSNGLTQPGTPFVAARRSVLGASIAMRSFLQSDFVACPDIHTSKALILDSCLKNSPSRCYGPIHPDRKSVV